MMFLHNDKDIFIRNLLPFQSIQILSAAAFLFFLSTTEFFFLLCEVVAGVSVGMKRNKKNSKELFGCCSYV